MGIYLVDYENVHNDGVTDIQKLSASDRVVIFYGDSIKSIPCLLYTSPSPRDCS